MRHVPTFHHPALALAQAALNEAIHERHAREQGVSPGEAVSPHGPLNAGHEKMREMVAAGLASEPSEAAEHPAAAAAATSGCAQLYVAVVKMAWKSGAAAARELYEKTIADTDCDVLWGEAVEKYLAFLDSGEEIPYVRLGLHEGVRDLPSGPLKIAVVGDWGTGEGPARHVMQQIVEHGPDVLIHLGDIYYAGTPHEVKRNFLDVLDCYRELDGVPKFSLSGNHDMYSGGIGYYRHLLPALGQEASYFCLRNPHWQLVAMDTGLHDRDPFNVLWNTTRLERSEAEWVRDKVENAGGRKTILLSHHQLFSGSSPVGTTCSLFGGRRSWGVNPRLYRQLRDVLDPEKVPLWLWGHEHNSVVFQEPKKGKLPRGRCVGAGAIPTFVSQDPYKAHKGLVAPRGLSVPAMDLRYQLGSSEVNGEDLYYHGYAIVELDGPRGEVTYWQVPPEGPRELFFRESIGEPSRKVPGVSIKGISSEVSP